MWWAYGLALALFLAFMAATFRLMRRELLKLLTGVQQQLDQERDLQRQRESLRARESLLDAREEQIRLALEQAAGLTAAQARDRLEQEANRRVELWMADRLAAAESEARVSAQARSASMLGQVLARTAVAMPPTHYAESVPLPDEPSAAARVIGKGGINRREFEAATGVAISINDRARTVEVAHLDPWRRHVAARTIERLLAHGTITPALIREHYGAVLRQAQAQLAQDGEQAALAVGVAVPEPLLPRLGMLRFHVVAGREGLSTAVLGAAIADVIARELGMESQICKVAALLRDIGSTEPLLAQGDHAGVSADLAAAAGLPQAVCNAIRHHHQPWPNIVESGPTTVVALAELLVSEKLVRQGDVPNSVLRRIREIERLCEEDEAVLSAVALGVGDHVRVTVNARTVHEERLRHFALELGSKLKTTYGQAVVVTAVRESKATVRLPD